MLDSLKNCHCWSDVLFVHLGFAMHKLLHSPAPARKMQSLLSSKLYKRLPCLTTKTIMKSCNMQHGNGTCTCANLACKSFVQPGNAEHQAAELERIYWYRIRNATGHYAAHAANMGLVSCMLVAGCSTGNGAQRRLCT
jgi:hypothetical protein